MIYSYYVTHLHIFNNCQRLGKTKCQSIGYLFFGLHITLSSIKKYLTFCVAFNHLFKWVNVVFNKACVNHTTPWLSASLSTNTSDSYFPSTWQNSSHFSSSAVCEFSHSFFTTHLLICTAPSLFTSSLVPHMKSFYSWLPTPKDAANHLQAMAVTIFCEQFAPLRGKLLSI